MERSTGGWRVFSVLVVLALAAGLSSAAYAKDEGWLGVMLQPLSDELLEAMNLEPGTNGVLVSDVVKGGPAEAAGVQKGDVIVEIDGRSIGDTDEAIDAVRGMSPGEKAKLVVVREGKKQVIAAVLGDRAELADSEIKVKEGRLKASEKKIRDLDIRLPKVDEIMPRAERMLQSCKVGRGYIGVRIQDVSAEMGAYFGVGEGEGVLILGVEDDSPADEAGLRDGDVVIKVDNEPVFSSGKFADYIRNCEPGDKVNITFKRNKETRRLDVIVGKDSSPMRMFLGGSVDPGNPGASMWKGGDPGCCKQGAMPDVCMDKGKHKCIIMKKGAGADDEECMKWIQIGDDDSEDVIGILGDDDNEDIENIKVIRPHMVQQDLKKEMEGLRQEIEQLKQEIETLKK
jgi:predicted metalloprotease with PDZ domain